MGYRSFVVTGFPKEEKERAFKSFELNWSDVVEKDGMVFCRNDWDWKWYDGFKNVEEWHSFMDELEEKYDEEQFFTLVVGEDFQVNERSVNWYTGEEYGFYLDFNVDGRVFKRNRWELEDESCDLTKDE